MALIGHPLFKCGSLLLVPLLQRLTLLIPGLGGLRTRLCGVRELLQLTLLTLLKLLGLAGELAEDFFFPLTELFELLRVPLLNLSYELALFVLDLLLLRSGRLIVLLELIELPLHGTPEALHLFLLGLSLVGGVEAHFSHLFAWRNLTWSLIEANALLNTKLLLLADLLLTLTIK